MAQAILMCHPRHMDMVILFISLSCALGCSHVRESEMLAAPELPNPRPTQRFSGLAASTNPTTCIRWMRMQRCRSNARLIITVTVQCCYALLCEHLIG